MAKALPHIPWLLLFAFVQIDSRMQLWMCVNERLNFADNFITQIVSVSYLMYFETRIKHLIKSVMQILCT